MLPGCIVAFLGMPREGLPFITMSLERTVEAVCTGAMGLGRSAAAASRLSARTNMTNKEREEKELGRGWGGEGARWAARATLLHSPPLVPLPRTRRFHDIALTIPVWHPFMFEIPSIGFLVARA